MPSPPALLCKTLIKEPLFSHKLLRQLCLAALLLIFTPDSEGPAGSAPGSNSCLSLRNCGWALLLQGSGRAPRGRGAAPDPGWAVNRSPPSLLVAPFHVGDPRAHPTLLPTFPLCHMRAGLGPAAPSPATCGISPRGISPRPDRTGSCFAVIVSGWILRHQTGRFGIGVTGLLPQACPFLL